MHLIFHFRDENTQHYFQKPDTLQLVDNVLFDAHQKAKKLEANVHHTASWLPERSIPGPARVYISLT